MVASSRTCRASDDGRGLVGDPPGGPSPLTSASICRYEALLRPENGAFGVVTADQRRLLYIEADATNSDDLLNISGQSRDLSLSEVIFLNKQCRIKKKKQAKKNKEKVFRSLNRALFPVCACFRTCVFVQAAHAFRTLDLVAASNGLNLDGTVRVLLVDTLQVEKTKKKHSDLLKSFSPSFFLFPFSFFFFHSFFF